MTQEEKYKEALLEARAVLEPCLKYSNGKVREALDSIDKELKSFESEDERIRMALVEYFGPKVQLDFVRGVPIQKIRDWLEKQKIFSNGEGLYYYRPDGNCTFMGTGLGPIERVTINGEPPKTENNSVDLPDSVKINQIGVMAESEEKQKEQEPAGWKPQPESLEALMYAIEGKWNMIPPTSYLSRRLEDLYEGLVSTYNVDESLIAELPKTAYTAKDIEELRALKAKIEASMDEASAEWNANDKAFIKDCARILDENGYTTSAERLLSMFPVKQEWSEEDEKNLELVIDCIYEYYPDPVKKYKLKDWLKFLRPQPQGTYKQVIQTIFGMLKDKDFYEIQPSHRVSLLNDIRVKCKDAIECAPILDEPHWKPSEEQMAALYEAAQDAAIDREGGNALYEIYEQLKKL